MNRRAFLAATIAAPFAPKEPDGLTADDKRWFIEQLHDLETSLARIKWDAEMVRDFSPGGRGTALLEQVDRDINDCTFRLMRLRS